MFQLLTMALSVFHREALTAALSSNSVLQKLDLGRNPGLTASAALSIAVAINKEGTNSCLTSLDISAAQLQVNIFVNPVLQWDLII